MRKLEYFVFLFSNLFFSSECSQGDGVVLGMFCWFYKYLNLPGFSESRFERILLVDKDEHDRKSATEDTIFIKVRILTAVLVLN